MSPPERFLLVLQGTDEKKIVLEFESEHFLTGKWNAAKDLGVWVRRLTAEEFESDEYRGVLHYDMRHSRHQLHFPFGTMEKLFNE